MRKYASLVLILTLLVACSTKSYDDAVKSALSQPMGRSTNHTKELIKYYLPPHTGRQESNKNSTIFKVEGYEVLMKINIDYIISDNFDYEISDKFQYNKRIIFETDATYIDNKEQTKTMKIKVFNLDHKQDILIVIDNEEVELLSIVREKHADIVIETMISVLRSVELNYDTIVANYSNKDNVQIKTNYAEFFEQTPPESGTLKEMYDKLEQGND